jgi:uncharacterized protein (DUF1501 family)
MKHRERCDGATRRDFLRVGGLSALGFGLGDFLAAQRLSGVGSPRQKARSCILIWLDGGPSHLDTFDPKPDAPREIRGPFGSIATKLPGVRISEHLPRTAKILDKVAMLRAVTSPFGVHNFAAQYLMTGHEPTPSVDYPTFGSTLAHVREQAGVLPPNVAVPDLISRDRAALGAGYLPGENAPFALGSDPGKRGFKVRDLDFYKGLDLDRIGRRRRFVDALDEFSRGKDASPGAKTDPDLQRAYDLITSPEAKKAFDLGEEKDAVRELYTFDRRAHLDNSNNIGQQCLLARRLVERGVPFVTVNNTGWDNHYDLQTYASRTPGDPDQVGGHALIPGFDKAFSALIRDLSARGMLDETLVLVMGEFGRTPKINTNGGRDHWPNCFSVLMAGGGVAGGQVIGASDALGEFPKDRPVTPSDLAATIYTLLGVDPARELHTLDGRPIRIAPSGSKVIREVVGG